jgi:glycosyltransferase involved in cell wall biosynthesis
MMSAARAQGVIRGSPEGLRFTFCAFNVRNTFGVEPPFNRLCMRILLLTLVPPNPPDSGPKVKTHYLLRYLAQRHTVTLVSFVRSEAEEAAARALEGLCQDVYTVPIRRSRGRDVAYLLASLASPQPFLMLRDESRAMRRLVADLAAREPFDVVHADQLNMMRFALATRLPVVLDAHNAVWTIFRRLAQQERGLKRLLLELDWRKLKRYEGSLCRASAAVMAVSAEDHAALLAAGAREPIVDIPIAVDVAGIAPVARHPDACGVLSMATMYWPPNIDGVLWFAREVLPHIRRSAPDAPFYVVGARPPVEVRALGDDPAIQVTGYVDDPRPYLESSAVMVVPLRAGGGMRVKILEALARGIPIVSTTIGAEGIDVVDGEHLLIADEPAAFAEAVVRLLHDRALADRLAQAGRRHALARYDWRAVCPAIEQVYDRAIGRPAAQPLALTE